MPSPIRKVLIGHPTAVLTSLWLSVVGVISFMTYASYYEFREAQGLMKERSQTYAHLIASHDAFYIERAHGLLMEIEDHISFSDLNSEVAPARRKEIEALLLSHRDRLKGIASFSLIGADGIRRYGVVGKNFTNLNDRGYFIALKDGSHSTYVSATEDGRASGKSGIHVARRLSFGDRFGGVVVINLAVKDIFEPFYASLEIGNNASITLRSRTKLLGRYPQHGSTFGQELPPSSDVSKLILQGLSQGTVRATSAVDGVERLYSFQQLSDADLYAVVGISCEEALAGAKNGLIAAIAASLVALLAGLLATVGIRKLVQDKNAIQKIAHHDVLTGLKNRLYLVDSFDSTLNRVSLERGYLGMIFIDLDNFKLVNDNFGHTNGDVLLRDVALRFSSALDDTDEIIRIGGDEFIVLHRVNQGDPKDSVENLCWKLMQTLKEPFVIAGESIISSASLGAAIYPFHGKNLDELSRAADLAMYRGKAFGKGVFTIYYPALEEGSSKQILTTQSELAVAIERKEFELYFAPTVCLRSGKTTGAEALLRWRKPDGNIISASKFMDVAETTGLIIPIGNWVIEETCRVAARWVALDLPKMLFSINVSAVQINQSNVEHIIIRAINDNRIPASMIQLEITESMMLMDNDVVHGRIARLHEMGIRFAVDDFGTGYSSLAYIHKYNVDAIKIDRVFGDIGNDDAKKLPLLSAIISMARSLGLTTIAEGVERNEALVALSALGCDEAQGYIFSRALSPDGLIEFVREFELTLPSNH